MFLAVARHAAQRGNNTMLDFLPSLLAGWLAMLAVPFSRHLTGFSVVILLLFAPGAGGS